MSDPRKDKVISLYDTLKKEFPRPVDAMVALEYLVASAIISGTEPLNKENIKSNTYRFFRNMDKRANDMMHGIKNNRPSIGLVK